MTVIGVNGVKQNFKKSGRMKNKLKLEGRKTYRHELNPQEKIFHDIFVKEFNYENLEQMVFNKGEKPDYLENDTIETMITLIQWLGSPVGEGFLDQCGFKKESNEQ